MNEMKMDNNATVLGLFPTPVYTLEIPPELSTTCNYFDSVEQKEGDKIAEYGSHSENSYIMNEPECKELSDFVLGHVKIYADWSISHYTFSSK